LITVGVDLFSLSLSINAFFAVMDTRPRDEERKRFGVGVELEQNMNREL
jgi:hypothetical protein